MEKEIREWALAAREHMAPHGVTITGAHWYVPRQGQRKHNSLMACLDGTTTNRNLLGVKYDYRRRLRLLTMAYDVAFRKGGTRLPADDLSLDMRVCLQGDLVTGEPLTALEPTTPSTTPEMQFLPIDELIAKGEVEQHSMFFDYAQRYGLTDVLLFKGRVYMSPDNAPVELLEDLILQSRIRSVLEIGAGVGVCGVAAQRAGIRDYTFVDANSTVCQYLHTHFPSYAVHCADAMAIPLDRHWDVIILDIPYHLHPFLLQKRGAELAASCTTMIIQSGCRAFFDSEHEWLMFQDMHWPWFDLSQKLWRHFPHTAQYSVDWQLALVSSHDERLENRFSQLQSDKHRTTWEDQVLVL